MKKRVILFSTIFLVLIIGLNIVYAQDSDETTKVIKAYDCLEDEIEKRKCDSLSIGEKIFSFLSAKKCKSELIEASKKKDDKSECWPSNNCDIETTAQAILALHENNINTEEAEKWLLNQKKVPDELIWYLEIDTNKASSCTVGYKGKKYNIDIAENKQISGNPGSCLDFGPGETNYWLKINSNCHEEEFEIICEESFVTTLLFQERDSVTIHVTDSIHSRPEGGTSHEKIKSYCFEDSGSCDYEGSLWAALILDYLGEDVSSFIPYLVTGADNNKLKFPEPFLYMLTGESGYKTDTLETQINNEYWKVGTDRYYDTALALFPFKNQDLYEKEDAIKWLFDVQLESGCWDGGNIKNNAFLLYSIWPNLGPSGGSTNGDDDDNVTNYDNDCKLSNYFCMTSRSCEGNILSNYDCDGLYVCCDTETVEKTCNELSGEVCATNEYCLNGETVYAAGLNYGEDCCVDGTCKIREEEPSENECANAGGICESLSCGSGYSANSLYNCEGGRTCCIPDKKDEKNYLWIWILFILIILVTIGIIYREKLKELYMKMTHKGGEKPGPSGRPRRPGYPPAPTYNRMPTRPPIQRKIIPTKQPRRPPIQRSTKNPKELDDVLKKLKQMGK